MLRRAAPVAPSLCNRNPRNLERMRIAYKPDGYHLDKPGRGFWHRLEVEATGRTVTARVVHYERGTVVEASTREWAVKKQLYSAKDACAYANLGRVLAARCLRFGVQEMRGVETPSPGGKLEALVDKIREGGVALEEPPRYKHPRRWDLLRPHKFWETPEPK